jgi:drug/metabolite transporter (DMT)-like permease
VLVSTTPLWVALLAPLVLREKVGATAFIGLILALTGGVVVAVSDTCSLQAGVLACPPLQTFIGGRAFLGDFLALFGAWMAAGYMLVGRKVRAKMDLIPYIFIVYGMSALVLIAIMIGLRESPFGLPAPAYLWFLLLALLPQLFGHTVYNWSLKYVPASIVSITLLGEPIGSTILALVIFQETPGWVKILGALFILAGIWLAARSQNK